jgi:hypothetical protein
MVAQATSAAFGTSRTKKVASRSILRSRRFENLDLLADYLALLV